MNASSPPPAPKPFSAPGGLPAEVVRLVPGYLARQRWYAGHDEPDGDAMGVLDTAVLADDAGGARLLWALIEVEGLVYQLLIGERHAGQAADFLSSHEDAVLGSAGEYYYYDATLDSELGLRILDIVTEGKENAERVRPISVEQSNTSLVYDDRVIIKVFRRLLAGPNPDVEVTTALVRVGFAHVAPPVARWRRDDLDLAYAQEYLAGGSEGWALALTSLRDLYGSAYVDPAQAGGDFAGEASRLGRMTAEMHLAMAEAFEVSAGRRADESWRSLLAGFGDRLDRLGGELQLDLRDLAEPVLVRFAAVAAPGPVLRVHGDYHLGQVMRTDNGWYVLDFEGEPARPLEERLAPSSPLKDVAGMLRSFQYAAHFALNGWGTVEDDSVELRAEAWEHHNRQAFLEGYRSKAAVEAFLPAAAEDYEAVLAAYELDKALYELDYERAYRPDWVAIPLAAVTRILHRPAP